MQRVYDQLLAVRGGEAGGAELHAPALRLRLLRSLARLLGRAAQTLRQRLPSLPHSQRRRGALREVRLPLHPRLSSPVTVRRVAGLLSGPSLHLQLRCACRKGCLPSLLHSQCC